jgi:type I restriction enzyme, S subunit
MGEELSLNDVCSQIVDCEHKTAPEAAPGHEYGYSIGTPNIRDGRLLLSTAKRVDRSTYGYWTARETPRGNDIILTREAPVGEVAFLDGSEPICLGQRTVLLRPNPAMISPRYLHYRLLGPEMQVRLSTRAEGSTVAHLNVADIRRVTLGVLPRLTEQDSIARLLGAIDDKITLNDQVATTSLSLAQAQYDEAAGSESWHSLLMGQSARWLSGGTPSTTEPSYWDGDIPWISALSLKSPWIADSERAVTRLGVEHGTRVVPRGTVIFVVRGSSLDTEFRIGLTQREVAFGQDCKALLAPDGMDPAVLFLAIRSHSSEILTLVDHAGHGAGRLATDLITNVQIRLPDLSLEAEICSRLRHLVDLGARRQSENRTLLDLRDLLLPKLMSGEIRVRDAEQIVEDAT